MHLYTSFIMAEKNTKFNNFYLYFDKTFKIFRISYILIFSQSISIFANNFAYAEENPIGCEYYQEQDKVICDTKKTKIKVINAIINDGECKSPAQKLNEINTIRKELNKTTANPIALEKDFRKNYNFDEQFYLLVDSDCHLEKFEIQTTNATYSWEINQIRRLIYPNYLFY